MGLLFIRFLRCSAGAGCDLIDQEGSCSAAPRRAAPLRYRSPGSAFPGDSLIGNLFSNSRIPFFDFSTKLDMPLRPIEHKSPHYFLRVKTWKRINKEAKNERCCQKKITAAQKARWAKLRNIAKQPYLWAARRRLRKFPKLSLLPVTS